MGFGWGTPIGLGVFLAGLGIFLWGAQASKKVK
jgi:hypothetical protein